MWDQWKILLPIAVSFGLVFLTAWVNIAIRFAPDAIEAKREVKRIFGVVLFGILIVEFLGIIIWQAVWPFQKNTPAWIFLIGFAFLMLMHLFTLILIAKFVDVVLGKSGLSGTLREHLSLTSQIPQMIDEKIAQALGNRR
jgi:hypothetical protein